MKYVDLEVYFYTSEQMELTEEMRQQLTFGDMEIRTYRFYEPPLALVVAMEDGKPKATKAHFSFDVLFLTKLPKEVHEIINKVWG